MAPYDGQLWPSSLQAYRPSCISWQTSQQLRPSLPQLRQLWHTISIISLAKGHQYHIPSFPTILWVCIFSDREAFFILHALLAAIWLSLLPEAHCHSTYWEATDTFALLYHNHWSSVSSRWYLPRIFLNMPGLEFSSWKLGPMTSSDMLNVKFKWFQAYLLLKKNRNITLNAT